MAMTFAFSSMTFDIASTHNLGRFSITKRKIPPITIESSEMDTMSFTEEPLLAASIAEKSTPLWMISKSSTEYPIHSL